MLKLQTQALKALARDGDQDLKRPAVFIDKDGTLVENVPYSVDPAQLRFLPGALATLRELSRHGYALVVVTNQPGLALGRFTRSEFARLERALRLRLQEEGGVTLDGLYACPHAPGADGGPACLCRKPAPGLLRQAALMHRLDLTRSWMVGDILDDVEAGQRAGVRSVLLDVGNETLWQHSVLRTPHHRCTDWRQVGEAILAPAAPSRAAPDASIELAGVVAGGAAREAAGAGAGARDEAPPAPTAPTAPGPALFDAAHERAARSSLQVTV